MTERVQATRIEIESPDGFALRQLVPEDAQAYFDLIDYDRNHFQYGEEVTSRNYPTAEKVLESITHPKDPAKLRFGIWTGDEMVGSINLKPQENTAEVGYWIGKRFTGHGYATKAVRVLVEHAFGAADYRYLFAIVDPRNLASVRTLEKAGFHSADSSPQLSEKQLYILTRAEAARED